MIKLHRWIGFLGITTFVATGVWMRVTFPDIEGGVNIPRMMFRSAHIYILLASLLNLFAAIGGKEPARIGSILIALAPPTFLVAFLVEPSYLAPSRPICLLGVVFCLVGTLWTYFASRPKTTGEKEQPVAVTSG